MVKHRLGAYKNHFMSRRNDPNRWEKTLDLITK